MPTCVHCGKTKTKLNKGNYCKACLDNKKKTVVELRESDNYTVTDNNLFMSQRNRNSHTMNDNTTFISQGSRNNHPMNHNTPFKSQGNRSIHSINDNITFMPQGNKEMYTMNESISFTPPWNKNMQHINDNIAVMSQENRNMHFNSHNISNQDPNFFRNQYRDESVTNKLDVIINDIQFIKNEICQLKKLTTEVNNLKELVRIQQNTIRQQQIFLERLANQDRRNNLIITGLKESQDGVEDHDYINGIFRHLFPTDENEQPINLEFDVHRLGKVESARLPRPIKVELKGNSVKMCHKICMNSKNLKDNEHYGMIYIKRDEHPAFRKEHARLYKVVSDERKRPENIGTNIIYNRKDGIVIKENMVIDRFSPNFQ